MSLVVIGCDPGITGALAVMIDGHLHAVHDMPTLSIMVGKTNRNVVDENQLDNLLRALINGYVAPADKLHFVCENVGSRPKEGPVGAFSFGRGYGAIRGCVASLQLPRTYVNPADWSRALKLRRGKDANRQRAMELFPHKLDDFKRVKDDGRADAALIAYWATHHIPELRS